MIILKISTLFFLLTFLLLISFLDYKDITSYNYIKTNAKVLSNEMESKNCCKKICHSTCRTKRYSIEKCSSLLDKLSALTITDCFDSVEKCNKPRYCSDGYNCCVINYSKNCDSYENVGDSYKYRGKNCDCGIYTNNLACIIECNFCQNAKLTVSYTFNNKMFTSVLKRNFNPKTEEYNEFKKYYRKYKQIFVYVNINDPNEFYLDMNYNIGNWVITSIFGIIPLFICIVLWIIEFFRRITSVYKKSYDIPIAQAIYE